MHMQVSEYAARSTDSPIETMMLLGLIGSAKGRFPTVVIAREGEEPFSFRWGARDEFPMLLVCTQRKYLGFRVDMVLSAAFGGVPCRDCSVAVECDGHEFHERTKEQAQRDRSRDRIISGIRGVTLLRFTGSEINRNAEACGAEAIDLLLRKISELPR